MSAYYREVAVELHLGQRPARPKRGSTTVVVPFTSLSLLTSQALSQALSRGDQVVAVTVVFAEEKGRQAELEAAWKKWDPGVPLVVVTFQYRSVGRPLLRYIGSLKPSASHRMVVLIPVVLPRRFWHRLLHNHLDLVLSAALQRRPHVVVARLPLALRRE